jgi:hypothetical protein
VPTPTPIVAPPLQPIAVPPLRPQPQVPTATQTPIAVPPLGTAQQQPRLVTLTPGRQPPHLPAVFATSDGRRIDCVVSGFARRRYLDSERRVVEVGALPQLTAVNTLVRDVPAWHPDHADCIVAVRRAKRRAR